MSSDANRLTVCVLPMRQEGWLLPRWRQSFHRGLSGVLIVREEPVKDWNRHSRVARLLDVSGVDVAGVSPLFDVVLVHASAGGWTLNGVERLQIDVDDRVKEFAQSWMVQPVGLDLASA